MANNYLGNTSKFSRGMSAIKPGEKQRTRSRHHQLFVLNPPPMKQSLV